MCGIFGIVNLTNANDTSLIDEQKVVESSQLMAHRGPDAYGQWGIPRVVSLAHLRLSIIDLSSDSNQPFHSSCGRYVVVFNGEIYNYIELRRELATRGHAFRTSSDTEVLLGSYIEWGDGCVSHFNGDWAFAIYDTVRGSVFCSRDRFGVKPFNYAIHRNHLLFSSEIKPLLNYFPELRRPDFNVISNYCRNGLGAQHVDTWFTGVHRLPPAHNLTWHGTEVSEERYWEYPTTTLRHPTPDDAIDTYKQLFIDAVKLRMRSDVPVGTTLSSGIDSGSIVSSLRTFFDKGHKTFTATCDDTDFHDNEKSPYRGNITINERALVERLASQLDLDARMVDNGHTAFLDELGTVIYHLESGHSSPATVPLSRIFRFARQHVTVLLEGQGADELLGGYITNAFPVLLQELLVRGRLRQAWKEWVEFGRHYSIGYTAKLFVRSFNKGWIERLYHSSIGLQQVFGPKLRHYSHLTGLRTNVPAFGDRVNEYLCRSHSGGLVNLLHYGDALSMAQSLESRLPFVDIDLVEYAFQLPYDLKVRNGLGKYIHRRAMAGIVPDFILSNPLKFGFTTPLAVNFREPASPSVAVLLSDRCLERGIFDGAGMRKMLQDQTDDRRDSSTMLFRLLSTELWFRTFIDN